MLSQVDHRGARAVGAAEQVDLAVAERGPHVVNVVHRDRRGVEREIRFRFELLTALAHVFEREEVAEITLLIAGIDRKSTRLNSSHSQISYAVFCLKKKKKNNKT